METHNHWQLTSLYPTKALWRKDIAALATATQALEYHKNTLTTGEALLNCLDLFYQGEEMANRITVYPGLQLSQDITSATAQKMVDQAERAVEAFYSATAFIEPEILSLKDKTLEKFIQNTPGLMIYRHYLEDLIRSRDHVLSAEIESLLETIEHITDAPEEIFTMLEDADMDFGTVTDENGNTVALTHGSYDALIDSPCQKVRKAVYQAYKAPYLAAKNTIATTLVASIQKDATLAQLRNHPTALAAALFEDNIPTKVYNQLIKTVGQFIPALQKYITLRKKMLKLDEIHLYDISAATQAEESIPYATAQELFLKAVAPLGEEYVNTAKHGMDNGWVDVYEAPNKESGAYTWGAYGNHPYVLLNYNNTMEDAFTLAHEMGHAMHRHYSWMYQPSVYGDASDFTGEIASTVNEVLMIEYLLESNPSPQLLVKYLEQFRTTVFVQTMYAEFEKIVHGMAADDDTPTLDDLNEIYHNLLVKYYGEELVIDPESQMGWAVSHFFDAFYVYQYATGYAAALAIVKQLDNPKGVSKYLEFLKAGGSNYPCTLLKKAGVNLNTPAPICSALETFTALVDKLEAML